MAARMRNSSSPGVFSVRDMEGGGGTHWEISPDMRAGAPLVRPRVRALKRAVWSAVLIATGLAAFETRDYWLGTLMAAVGELRLVSGRVASNVPAAAGPPLAPPSLPPLKEGVEIKPDALDLSPATRSAAGAADGAMDGKNGGDGLETASDSAAAEPTSGVAAKPEPLPPLPPLTDPLQKRAEAVGLHPEVSRALLQRFTADDFQNAGMAIRKAIAETPDGEALIWPAQARKGIARFRVHFVPGVSDACRRYVVAVAKDGWLTTALPMEKCGVPRPKLLNIKHKNPKAVGR